MNVGMMRIGFAIFWLGIGVVAFLRHQLLPPEIAERFDSSNITIGGLLAFALAGWNLTRWYLSRRPRQDEEPLARRKPLERREDEPRHEEYIPELDFTRPAPEAPRGQDTEAPGGTSR
ncbi:hypothetical protein [Fimbriiglobus ruber]|uniref:Uncharacterized protein n=1 Tax=Fimbriiglobus ruber TaxID=1908690 RepID=A0A225D865_9BACT|nr:hypothetical protein [Fimbriiglobus ruber]OWK34738.1 hypothetical protein FRUB_09580 [Fimbriiglobus ruber]